MPDLLLGPVLRHVADRTATVWVETGGRCTVTVECSSGAVGIAPTFAVEGHHYALVVVTGLSPGVTTPYTVRLDDVPVWPAAEPPLPGAPPSVIATPSPGGPRQVAFGSCRAPVPDAAGGDPGADPLEPDPLEPDQLGPDPLGPDPLGPDPLGPDALEAFAVRAASSGAPLPDLLLMLGDQVYADETSRRTAARIAQRRPGVPPQHQVGDFEEYTWLYDEAWRCGPVRWLLSTVPVAMIFDDHDVHDDWNTSAAWRSDMQAKPWWRERLTGGLVSYWVYQHLGNLSPTELADDAVYAAVRECAASGEDAAPVLRALAASADAAVGDSAADGYRWSFWRDLGPLRLVVLDSRCGRVLSGADRSMLAESTFAWMQDRLAGEYEHLAVGTSLPWLMVPPFQSAEAWNERLVGRGGLRRRLGERLRRGADLEHWAAFGSSFERLASTLRQVASSPAAPVTISVLSGDVHHSYVSRVTLGSGSSRVYQLTCSPVHNLVTGALKVGLRTTWSPIATLVSDGVFHRLLRVPRPSVAWRTLDGPFFGNCIATLSVDGRSAQVTVEAAVRNGPGGGSGGGSGLGLRTVAIRPL